MPTPYVHRSSSVPPVAQLVDTVQYILAGKAAPQAELAD